MTVRNVLRAGAILAVIIYSALPVYWLVINAVRPVEELFTAFPPWIPGGLSFDAIGRLFSAIPFGHYVLNSVIVAVGTSVVAVVIATLGAYGLARFEFRGQTVSVMVLLFAVTIPAAVVQVPFYLFLRSVGLLNTHLGLIFSYSIWAVPFTVLLLRGYLRTAYNREIEEAALLDGCTRVSVLWRIVVPLSLPGIVAAAIVSATFAWNEYVWASIVVTGDGVRTLPVGLQLFAGQFGLNPSLQQWFVGSLLAMLPLLVVFTFAQSRVASAYGIVEV